MLAALALARASSRDRTSARHVGFTVQALRALGAKIESAGVGWRVTGGGGFSPNSDEVSVGSSGTTLYFLLGLAALGDRPVTDRRAALLPPAPDRPAAARAQADGRPPGVRGPAPAGDGLSRPPDRRPDPDRRHALAVDLGPAHARAVRAEPTTIEVRGELNEQPVPRADARDDAPVRPRGHARARTGASSTSRPTSARRPPTSTLPADIGSAMFGLAACTLHPSKVTFRSPTDDRRPSRGRRARQPDGRRGPVPDRARPAVDLDGPRRHPARGRPARLPRHPGHGPDPVRAGQPGPRAQRARPRRPRAPERVRPCRLDAPAAQDGRADRVRRQRHDVRGRRAAARRELCRRSTTTAC